MIWLIIIILAVVGYLVYITLADRDKALRKQVDSHGGMMLKYDSLVEAFLVSGISRVTKVTRERIEIIDPIPGKETEYYTINEGMGCVDIEWKLVHRDGRTHKLNWKFREGETQHHMFLKIAIQINSIRALYQH